MRSLSLLASAFWLARLVFATAALGMAVRSMTTTPGILLKVRIPATLLFLANEVEAMDCETFDIRSLASTRSVRATVPSNFTVF